MENKELQILSEIKDLMDSLRAQIELLETKIAQLQHVAGQEDDDMTPIDLDLDDMMVEPVVEIPEIEDVVEQVAEVPEAEVPEIVEDTVDDDLPFDDIPAEPVEEPMEEPAEEPVEEPVEEPSEEPVEEPIEEQDDDLPIFAEPEPEPVQQTAPIDRKPRQAVIDSMTDRQAWRTDMPGTPVKDIRSAISLNDRILFINMLFGQDPMAFQDALTKINQMASLDEVVDFVVNERPEWDLESETVYRFMMAVRRKIR
jgi:hypothetical protein